MTDALGVDLGAPCFLWLGSTSGGYGQLTIRGAHWKAHRYMWTVMRGPIPDGMQIDHLCRNRACVNPQHMELVTPKENTRRGLNANSRKTHCPRGHPYDGANTRLYRGGRFCRACSAIHSTRYQRVRLSTPCA